MVNELYKEQIDDSSIVEEDELSSSGMLSTPFNSSIIIQSVVTLTSTITISSGDFNEPRVQKNDILVISGGASAGVYTVNEVLSDSILTVNESIVSSVTGSIAIYYRSGAEIVGYDSTDSTVFDNTIDTVKKALDAIQNVAGGSSFETFFNASNQNTTSNNWKLRDIYTSSVKNLGQYILLHTAQVGQSKDDRQVGHRVQFRLGTSGSWTTLVSIKDGVSSDNQYQLRTGFNVISISVPSVIQIRIQWGQTDDGGVGKIKASGVTILKAT